MKVSVISSDNGVGLSRDANIIIRLLRNSGHDAWFQDWREAKPHTADINIHLELIGIKAMRSARKNIFIPNPEWFEDGFRMACKNMDAIFAKTRDTERIFRTIHPKVIFTGFTSIDRYMPEVKKKKKFVHFAGKSLLKGTDAVIEASRISGVHVDVRRYSANISDEEFARMQNEALIHVCPSEYEGFGHYINEAKSCKAVVITTSHVPMSELVQPIFGFGAAVEKFNRIRLATGAKVSVQSLADMLTIVNKTDVSLLKKFGERARISYLNADSRFKEVFMKEILSI